MEIKKAGIDDVTDKIRPMILELYQQKKNM